MRRLFERRQLVPHLATALFAVCILFMSLNLTAAAITVSSEEPTAASRIRRPSLAMSDINRRLKTLEQSLKKLGEKNTALELANKKEKAAAASRDGLITSLAKQLTTQQLAWEESKRSDGNSGIKQIRSRDQGTKNYFHSSVVSTAPMTMHDHSNMETTVGMGEFIAVMNGVEFRTRHNDYLLYKPANHSRFKNIAKIDFPEVPPEVKKLPTIKGQIKEMQEWFKAWRDQNHTMRDYRKYFKPVMCYLEGMWTLPERSIEEPFRSDRHHLDADSFEDLEDKVRFTSYVGRKHEYENYAFLPSKIASVKNGKITKAQWNYRILCHPISFDIPLSQLRPIDDLPTRLKHMTTYSKLSQSRKSRFQLWPSFKYGNKEVMSDFRSTLDQIMQEIPGVQNYGAQITDNITDHLLLKSDYGSQNTTLNANYYHRWFTSRGAGDMSYSLRRRGFSDDNLFVALNQQSRVMPETLTTCVKNEKTKEKACQSYTQRASYAIPLEIVYMNPLLSWNPYGIELKAKSDVSVAASQHRNGNCNEKGMAYNGTHGNVHYITPKEFFSGTEVEKDKADTTRSWVCVLDRTSTPRKMAASGTRVIMPNIPGVGKLRQRYPIFPVHQEGSHIFKEVEALRELIMEPDRYKKLYHHPLTGSVTGSNSGGEPTGTFEVDAGITFVLSGGSSAHTHTFEINSDDLEVLISGKTVSKVTSDVAGHSHLAEVQLTTKNGKDVFILVKCDGKEKCFDGHSQIYPE